MKRVLLFLDRDGVINEDLGYVYKKDIRFIPGIFELVRAANELNYLVKNHESGRHWKRVLY